MSPSWVSKPLDQDKIYPTVPKSEKGRPRSCLPCRTKKSWIILAAVLLLIAIGLGVGLGVGLTQGSSSTSGTGTTSPSSPLGNITNSTTGTFWRPQAGASWQIVLEYALNDTSVNASVYDIDLFDNPASTIDSLHAMDRRVVCYFSAGSYESFRPDSGQFTPSDYGKELDGWPGEYWLNTNSTNVRNIMTSRLQLAASKGCDGVDPDNVDGYDNDTGLNLTTSDAVDYLTFLTTGAHSLNMSLGLKNAGEIVNQTIDMMQWEVNEQCVQYQECDLFRPFIGAGNPVFHIEYPKSAPDVSEASKEEYCNDSMAQGFSTILKDLDLDNWIDTC